MRYFIRPMSIVTATIGKIMINEVCTSFPFDGLVPKKDSQQVQHS